MERLTIYLALGAMLFGISTAVSCFDCWYWSGSSSDDNCNYASELYKVANETCSGQCYTTKYTLGSLFVKRGCLDDCQAGETSIDKLPLVSATRTCCTGDNCNDEIISAAVTSRVSMPMYILCAAAAFALRRLK